MIFRRLRQQRHESKHLRIRIESCVTTILDLNRLLGDGKIKPDVIKQFEKLKDSLKYVTDDSVDEKDINRIEEATNQLLAEIRMLYGEKHVSSLHEGPAH